MNMLQPQWQAPAHVSALSTTRQGGASLPPFDSLNLGDHVGDEKNVVKTNRTLLTREGGLPHFPLFLNQTHSTRVIRLPYAGSQPPEADAVYTDQPNQVCVVMTADCLPVLFCNRAGNEVAAAHAGWRGLCDGILEATVAQFQSPPEEIMAWLGPAIGNTAFQVGREVVDQFVAQDPKAECAFVRDKSAVDFDKFFGDLYQLARQRLNRVGVKQISGGEYCTYSQPADFFSYRRDGRTGRMASLIWFA